MEAPLIAVERTKLNMNIRNRMWKVRLRTAVETPAITRLISITFRESWRSKRCPIRGWVTPFTSQPRAAATEIVVRLQSKVSLIGITKTPNPFRAPVVTAAINIAVTTMYHP